MEMIYYVTWTWRDMNGKVVSVLAHSPEEAKEAVAYEMALYYDDVIWSVFDCKPTTFGGKQ